MKMRRRDVLKASGMAFAGAVTSHLIHRPLFAQSNAFIERDVCVIGGGSAGTYVSVRLGDYGKSVVLLERTGRLGGHAETYIVPGLGVPIDIGVVDFEATPVVENYFNRFKVNYVPSPTSGGPSVNVDLRTGLPLSNYTPPSEAAVGAALSTYYEILATKYPYLDAGSTPIRSRRSSRNPSPTSLPITGYRRSFPPSSSTHREPAICSRILFCMC